MKNNPGSFVDDINIILDRFTEAGGVAHLADRKIGLVRSIPEMEAEIRRRYAELARPLDLAAVVVPSLLPAPPRGMLDYMDQGIAERSRKVSLRNGQSLSKSYLTSLARTRTVLADFYLQLQPKHVLRFGAVDHAFYASF